MKSHWTKIYPNVFTSLSPASQERRQRFPQVTLPKRPPFMPNPITESQVRQSFSWLAAMPILAWRSLLSLTLNPRLLQFGCLNEGLHIKSFVNRAFSHDFMATILVLQHGHNLICLLCIMGFSETLSTILELIQKFSESHSAFFPLGLVDSKPLFGSTTKH